jgi:hypothetical protein
MPYIFIVRMIFLQVICFKRKFCRQLFLQKRFPVQQVHAAIDQPFFIKLFFPERSNCLVRIQFHRAVPVKMLHGFQRQSYNLHHGVHEKPLAGLDRS